MRFTTSIFTLAAFASAVLAHMEMEDPAPFRSKANKKIDQGTVDFDMASPLSASGDNFPCKGYQSDFNKSPAGDPTATWPAGSQQKVTLTDSAAHNGGSCQLSMSFDGGKTFRVIKSIEGGCVKPEGGEHSFDFTVPADTKSGKAIFAWTWFNHTGNREMYMNCAAVDITGSGTSTLEDRPEIFKANIGNGCTVPEGTDVQFPDPGPDVQVIDKTNLGPPTGNCPASSSSPNSPPPANSDAPDSTSSADPSQSTNPTDSKPNDPKPNPADPSPTQTTSPNDDHTEKPVQQPAYPGDNSDSTTGTTGTGTGNPTDATNSDQATGTDTEKPVVPTGPGNLAPTNTGTSTGTSTSTSTGTGTLGAPQSTATPPTSGVGTSYTVKSGDICTNIASKQGVPLATIFKLNPAINKGCTNLMPGQVLTIRRRSRIMRDFN